jgi:thioesterase domain-containing protein
VNRPELTAEKFVPDPFTNQLGAKLYRTGDLCRWLPNKSVEYLGRLDFQVKLHGLRIELGEIETVLGRQASVQQCVVVAREPQPGNKILVAYLEPRPGTQPDVSELRDHLKQSLPEYMVPSAFVLLDKLPLSPNGKIDRNALPNSDSLRLHAKGEFVAPRDSLEQMLTQLWAKVLRVKRVGLNDNFFELGGHSLLALRVALEIERSCHKRLPLATFLQAPTIAELAEVLRRDSWTPSWSSLVPIRPGGSKPPLFFMHSHGGNVLEYYPLANLLGEDQPVFALQARGLDGNIVRDESIEQIAAAYLSEIRLLQPQGPYFLSGFCFGGLVALEAAQQLVTAGDEVALVAMIQTTHPALSGFQPSDTLLRRWWHRTAKRFDLERSNLVHRGPGYLQERFLRAVAVARTRTLLKFDKLVSNGGPRPVRSSMPYVLEALGAEHDRAFDRYQPQPYGGKVVLFRAAKQLPGLAENPSLGWADVLGKYLTVINISGHQQNLLVEPNVLVLAKEFSRLIYLAQSELVPELV